jgi:hypothetical protein
MVLAVRHDPAVVLAAGVVDGPVVDHEAVVVQERAVANLPYLQARCVVREDVLRRPPRIRTAEVPLVERRHVPHGDIVARRLVLLPHVAEPLEPQPAAVGDMAATLRLSDGVERRLDGLVLTHPDLHRRLTSGRAHPDTALTGRSTRSCGVKRA